MRKIRRVKKASYYYHISSNVCLPENYTFKPRIPYTCGETEPDIKRVCVSSSISKCLAAIVDPSGELFVYKTKRKVKPFCSYGTGDALITGEKWFLSKIKMKRICIIPEEVSGDMPSSARGDPDSINEQRKDLKKIRKILREYKNEVKWITKEKI